MLFRALLGRMCRSISGSSFGFGGSSGSEPGARVSFQKYPDLPQLLSRLLAPSSKETEIGDNASVTERVFPALELIGEKVPFPGDDTTVLRKLVLQQLNSPVWAIREHSARVYASLLSRSDILTEIQSLLDIERDQTAQNYLHGKSLCIRYALSRFASAPVVLWKGSCSLYFPGEYYLISFRKYWKNNVHRKALICGLISFRQISSRCGVLDRDLK